MGGVVSSIKPVQNTDAQYARFLFHGEAGIGKTVLASSAPNSLMLFNNSEQGAGAARNGSDADSVVVRDYTDMDEILEWLEHSRDNKYDWISWDNSSLFQDQGMQEIMDDVVMAKPSRNLFIPDKPEYLMSQQRMYRIMTRLNALPANLIVVAHSMEMDTEDENGKGIIKIVPMYQGGQGAFSEKMAGMVSTVGYLHFKEVMVSGEKQNVRYLTMERGGLGRVSVKDGYGIGNVPMPTMPKLLEKMKIPDNKASRPARKAVGAKKVAGAKKAPAKKAAGVTKKAPAKKALAAKKAAR